MFTRNLGLGAAALLFAGVLWWTLGPRQDDSADGAVVAPDTARPEVPVTPVTDGAVATPPAVSSTGSVVPVPPTMDAAVTSAAGSTVPEPPADPVPATANAPETGSAGNLDFTLDERSIPMADGPLPEAGDSARNGEPVVVPSSYPISDAAKYFVPREERRPGNLGGPPPLDFPGGPNDPAGEGGFGPPPAPGD